MKTKKLTALILSILMIVSLLPTSVFALPSAVTVADTAHEHPMFHDSEHADSASLAAEGTLEVKLYDTYADSWNDASLEVYKGMTLVETLTLSEENDDGLEEKTVTVEGYDDAYTYSFVWQKGDYDEECGFDIIVNGVTVFSMETGSLSKTEGGTTLYTLMSSCTHEIGEGTLVCTLCGLTCGTDFAHEYTNGVCDICKTECGTETAPHDWTNKDGVCKVCKAVCTHTFTDNVCTVCNYVQKAYVVVGETKTYYTTFAEALEAAVANEGSTLFLNDNVHFAEALAINKGKFTLDLNGKTLSSDTGVLYIYFETELTICDSVGTGRIETLNSHKGYASLFIANSSKVTIDGGTFEGSVEICDSNTTLTIEDGSFLSYVWIKNGSTTINGGAFAEGVNLCGGGIVFSYFSGIEKFIVYNQQDDAIPVSDITLPEGYVFVDNLELEVTQLEYDAGYSIREKANLPEIPLGIHILIRDKYGDTWNSSKIEIYKGEELVGTAEINETNITLDSFTLEYDPNFAYTFKWITGEFDNECSFAIFVDKQLKYKTGDAQSSFNDTDATILELEVACNHEFEDGSLVCKKCEKECGKDFAHAFGDDTVCDTCGFFCGAEDSPHSYKSGVCSVCAAVCSHSFTDNVCDTCKLVRLAAVQVDETINIFESLESAYAFASENNSSTIILYNDVDLGNSLYDITKGKFTLDLNGHTVTSNTYTLYLSDLADVTVKDSSDSGTGKIETTDSNSFAVILTQASKFTLDSGTLENSDDFSKVVYIDDDGDDGTEATFVMNGGKIAGSESITTITVQSSFVHINGGELSGIIEYISGTLLFDEHPNPSGIAVYNNSGVDASDYIMLPRGCYFEDEEGNEVSTLTADSVYTIAGTPAIVIDIGYRADSANKRYMVVNGVRNSEVIPEEGTKIAIPAPESDTLVEVIEKANVDDTTHVHTQYFFIDAETRLVTTLSLDNYSTMYDETQVRVGDSEGLRFIADIQTVAKREETDFVIDEYGFIVATENNLGDSQLTLDFSNYAKGVAYDKDENIDKVFDSSSDYFHVFTGVLINIPVAHYTTNVVCRTYTKITIDGSQFVIYGEEKTGNLYDSAIAALQGDPENADLQKIIDDYDDFVDDIIPV